jgi:hypothetical protein
MMNNWLNLAFALPYLFFLACFWYTHAMGASESYSQLFVVRDRQTYT